MPIYIYQCDSCGITFERQQSFNDTPLTHCPECDGHVHRVIQPVGIVFKGSGFYVTDNRAKSSTSLPGSKKETKQDSPSSDSNSNGADSKKTT
jgi:putative FmdB family regulatory protein